MCGRTSVCLFLVVMLLSACATPEKRLNEAVKQVNSECPIGYGMAGELSKVAVEDTSVVLSLKMNESFVNLDALKANPSMLKTTLKTLFIDPPYAVRELLELMIVCKKSLRCVYEGASSDKSASATLTVDDIQNLLDAKVDEAEKNDARLEESIKISNLSCPVDLGNGLVMEGMQVEGDNVVYVYSLDETQADIEQMKTKTAQIRQGIRQSLSSNDPSLRQFVQMCVDCNKGIVYRYVGSTSGDILEISFLVSELP